MRNKHAPRSNFIPSRSSISPEPDAPHESEVPNRPRSETPDPRKRFTFAFGGGLSDVQPSEDPKPTSRPLSSKGSAQLVIDPRASVQSNSNVSSSAPSKHSSNDGGTGVIDSVSARVVTAEVRKAEEAAKENSKEAKRQKKQTGQTGQKNLAREKGTTAKSRSENSDDGQKNLAHVKEMIKKIRSESPGA